MKEKFDAIVIGAGPAGCACGYTLARAGMQVLVVERGKFAGAKNMWGGALYGPILGDLIPNFWEEAPFERYIACHRFSALSKDSCLSADFTTPKFSEPPYNGVTILRSKFDRWFATKVEEMGAIVATGLGAEDIIWDGNFIAGIEAGGDKLPASVIVSCEGVNSVITEKAGIKNKFKARDVKQGIKEVIALPRETIEQRFNLTGNEGIAWEFVGSFTRGLPGGGFIYSNKDSLSVGIVVQLNALAEKQVKANDMLEDFKAHPYIARLIDGGKLLEYSAHLIPVSGINTMPKLYRDGFLVAGDAAGFVVGTGLILEGANFAVASGIAAAETINRAKQRGDFSESSLAYYQELLEKSFVLKDLRTFKGAPHFLENQRIYSLYPDLACDLAEKLLTNDGKPRKKVWKHLREAMSSKVSLFQVARDLLKAVKTI